MKLLSSFQFFIITVSVAGFWPRRSCGRKCPADDSLTLETVLQKAIARNYSIAQASHALEAAHAHVQGLKSANYPTIDAEASYNTFTPNDPIPFPC